MNDIHIPDTLVYDIDNKRYINLTNSCTLTCKFCPKTLNHPIVHQYNLGLDIKHTAKQYIEQIGNPEDFEEIVFCGFGEPTIRIKVLLEIAKYIKDNGGKTRINTDGLANLVHKRNVLSEMTGIIDALSVSMNAQDEETYIKHCQPSLEGSYQAMLDFIKEAPKYVNDVTATAIEGLDGVDIEQCEKIAIKFGVKFRKRFLDNVG